MEQTLQNYAQYAGEDVIEHLSQLAAPLQGMKVAHVNSTKIGGGVAEILHKMVPLMQELGLDVTWDVIQGEPEFYQCTKSFHNTLQGDKIDIPNRLLRVYEETNAQTAEALQDKLREADIAIIHDPQPAALIKHFDKRPGKWVWRCHIDVSRPYRPVWQYLRNFVQYYDASVFSLPAFARPLPHPIYLIPPSIDPMHDKNVELTGREIQSVFKEFGISRSRPTILQVSRFDRFKDPIGVLQAFKKSRKFIPSLQLVLAGGGATDDPEGEVVLEELRQAVEDDPDVHILLLPGDAHKTINALQRGADLVLQKSLKEGFGLTVTEAMWKNKPVIGGDVGGIRIQVINYHTGFLVNSPEGAALRIRYLLDNREKLKEMGDKARDFVRDNFLITRHLREYLTLFVAMLHQKEQRIELS